ncbi:MULTISPECIES: type II toxin-antitoxin system RelE/ParE family toxin [Sphingobium]|uniref:Plasmid stabilization protein n=1 Tax=Sphingobium baderi LL03 TaxID=1114964 RepID=T0HX09_9SPHN|nr:MULTISPECIES: type II toxin-antitoxin system RelE/ParE family toxin [Sphingobium]AMK26035.1 plasmid stabilization system [Sphingobium sp. TKS]EQB02104.1 plasmid stabilization protein [Sphingobium baderi LL03]KMS55967.1 plasmid stabilization protein [Sphingobium baderi LL03]
MTCDVQLSALAIEDLIALHQWVSVEADIPTADGYLTRIEEGIAALADFLHRGSPRDDLVEGLQTLTFERRLLIAYNVDGNVANVQRVINAFRDLAPILQKS